MVSVRFKGSICTSLKWCPLSSKSSYYFTMLNKQMLKRNIEKITWQSIIIGHYPERLLEKWEMDLTFFWVGNHRAGKLIHSNAEFKHIINPQIIYIFLIPYLGWIHSQWLTQGWLICLTFIQSVSQSVSQSIFPEHYQYKSSSYKQGVYS